MYRILQTDSLAATIARFVVLAPLVARKRRAGQFVIVRVEDAGERIPLTIVDADPVRGTITLVVQAVGKTTRLLTKRAGATRSPTCWGRSATRRRSSASGRSPASAARSTSS